MEDKITAWIARDESGELFCFPHGKPIKITECDELDLSREGQWCYDDELLSMESSSVLPLNKKSFPQVKWEDEEPTKVELTIKIK